MNMVDYGPWNPGIESQVPRRLRHLITIFRPEHAFADHAKAQELADFTGLSATDLVAIRPQRLALHELLVRVTADFSVPDGSRIEDLGINFRRIVRALLARCIEPNAGAIESAYAAARQRLAGGIEAELDALLRTSTAAPETAPRPPQSWWRNPFTRRRGPTPPVEPDGDAEQRVIAAWERAARAPGDELHKAVCAALGRVVAALVIRHGRIWGDRALMASVALDLACNDFASREVGRAIDPFLGAAARDPGYRLLPRQDSPVVMNTKGPSASGKSTLRPLQQRLAGEIGVDWADFALISPDIWRKQLLDYDTLGADYRYAGAFTGDEVHIVDQKLDRYIAQKAERAGTSHLLIDRFRFDSFAPDSAEAGSNLLTRFGQIVYLFFVITPPASLVERAWNRGVEVGRYKAVDDTLAHSVEAYSGMPELFFTWAGRPDKRVHFEFLDNSVRQGERPRTVAFGVHDELNVLDVKCLLDVERYRRVNVDATGPEALFADAALLAPAANAAFLGQCIGRLRAVNFADQATGRIWLRMVSGAPVWVDREAFALATANPETRAGLLAAAPSVFGREIPAADGPRYLQAPADIEHAGTLGAWGSLA
jgi:hypothetical protein